MKIAIFDVCDTIYKVNTTFSFLDHFFENNKQYLLFRKISKLFPIKVFNYFFHKVFKKDLIRIYATSFLRGKEVQEIQNDCQDFVNTGLVQEIKDTTVAMLNQYKDQGYQIVLMSGSYAFIIEEVAKYFNVDHFYASKLNIVDGKYTGMYSEDVLLSKYELLKREFEDIDELIVVSDNKSDLALMQASDQAFAVCNKSDDMRFWEPYTNITCLKDY